MRARPTARATQGAILLFLVGVATSQARAGPISPVTYNVTDLSALNPLNATGFNASGNLIGQYSSSLNFVYTTSGPDAGMVQAFPIASTPTSRVARAGIAAGILLE